MTLPSIHPNWDLPPKGMTDGYSLEITAKDIDALRGSYSGVLALYERILATVRIAKN